MRDWEQVARQELVRRGLRCADDVASELGAFLDDAYQECVASGADPERAAELTSSRAGDWAQLARGLRRLEEAPMERVWRLWIPGLVNAALAFGLLRAATAAGLEPWVRLQEHGPLVVYWQWLPAFPILAAITTWWSVKQGAGAGERVVVALFPSLGMLSLVLLAFLSSIVIDPRVPLSVKIAGLGPYLLTWIVVPGVLSLLGAMPFVLGPRQRQRSMA